MEFTKLEAEIVRILTQAKADAAANGIAHPAVVSARMMTRILLAALAFISAGCRRRCTRWARVDAGFSPPARNMPRWPLPRTVRCADLPWPSGGCCAAIRSAAEASTRFPPARISPSGSATNRYHRRSGRCRCAARHDRKFPLPEYQNPNLQIAGWRRQRRWRRRHALPAGFRPAGDHRLLRFPVLRQAQAARACTGYANPEPAALRAAGSAAASAASRSLDVHGQSPVCRCVARHHRRRPRPRPRSRTRTTGSCSPIAARRSSTGS